MITTEIKKQMKGANKIVFRYRNGQTAMELIKEVKTDGFKHEVDNKVTIETRIDNYSYYHWNDKDYAYEMDEAFSYNQFMNDRLEWQTVVQCIKKDDELIAEWMLCNDCDNLREKGITSDSLYLIIRRNGVDKFKFLIDTWTGDFHSMARMCKLTKKFK